MANYEPSNVSDDFKHGNLEACVEHFNLCDMRYIEFHAGAGKYGNYDGSSVRVLKFLNDNKRPYEAYLHEKNAKRREQLTENVKGFSNVMVRGNWSDNINEYLQQANDQYLFLLDPTKIHDYREQKGLLWHLRLLLQTDAHIFMYVPQTERVVGHATIVTDIRDEIKKSGRSALDLMHPTVQGGHHKRIDHNILVAPDVCLQQAYNNHLQTFKKYENKKYKRFIGYGAKIIQI